MDIFPNPTYIPETRYNYVMSVMSKVGTLAFMPVTCKEMFCKSILIDILDFKYYGLYMDRYRWDKADLDCPNVVIWVRDNRSARANNIQEALNLLSSRMGLKSAIVRLVENNKTAIAIEVDPWYFKSSVSTHGLMTFIRIGAKRYPTSNLDKLINYTIENDDGDGEQLRVAVSTGCLVGFLDKTLPCLKRDGRSDWLVKRRSFEHAPVYSLSWHGIAGWRSWKDHPNGELMTDQDITSVYGTTIHYERVAPGARHSNWVAQSDYITMAMRPHEL